MSLLLAFRRFGLIPAIALALTGCAPTQPAPAGGAPEARARAGVVIYAVGDIADCHGKPPSESDAARTAALLKETAGPILALGDLAYPDGSYGDFATCFNPTWGALKPRLLPVPGNHEYHTPAAAPYYAYFGTAAGEAGKGYYSTRIGGWLVVALNSNIDAGAGSEQERWLSAELARNKTKCALAFWHHPVFTSAPRGNNRTMRDIWRTLEAAGVDVVLNGHEHQYERFVPQTTDGAADGSRGMRQFVVGTGGAQAVRFDRPRPNSEARETSILGALKLTLYEDGYAWKFLPVAGQKFNESGEGRCHD